MNVPARILATPERLRLRVEDYLALNDSGAFEAYTKTELIDGDIYVMNAQFSRHARVKSRLSFSLGVRLLELDSDLEQINEVAVRVADDSMPEPDIVLTRWRGNGAMPGDAVALAIEVAETTLTIDLGRKAVLYAAAGIAEYWVVDLVENRVWMHYQPASEGYRRRSDIPLGERLVSATVNGLEVGSVNLLG